MASQLKVDTLTGVTTAGSILVTGEGNSTTTNLQQGLAKSWVNFDGTGTSVGDVITPRDSFNVGSITDRGTGLYTKTFTSAMSNTNFAGAGVAKDVAGVATGRNRMIVSEANSTDDSFINSFDTSGNADDCGYITSIIFGDLA